MRQFCFLNHFFQVHSGSRVKLGLLRLAWTQLAAHLIEEMLIRLLLNDDVLLRFRLLNLLVQISFWEKCLHLPRVEDVIDDMA